MASKKNDKSENVIDWTEIDVTDNHASKNDKDDDVSGRFLEALMRVTFAGFGGALVGLSHKKKVSGATTIFQRAAMRTSVSARKNKNKPSSSSSSSSPPPKMMTMKQQRGGEETNYPLMWATSFMAFVSILETSRLLSPTTSIMNILHESQVSVSLSELENNNENGTTVEDTIPKQQRFVERPYYATLVDYTLGGTVAGLAGAMSNRGPPASSSTSKLQLPSAILQGGRRSLVLSGIGTGLALGFVAGFCQTALEAADAYLQEEEEEQEQLDEQQQKQNLLVEQEPEHEAQ